MSADVYCRRQAGDFLVEALVSSVIAAVVMAAVFSMYVQVHRAGNMAESQLYAAALAQEAVDNLRAQPFSTLVANLGTHTPTVIGSSSGGSTDQVFPRPLLIDTALDYTGNGNAAVSQAYGAHKGFTAVNPNTGNSTNTITVTLSQTVAGASNPVNVSVTVGYLDSSGKPRQLTLNSIITPDGLSG